MSAEQEQITTITDKNDKDAKAAEFETKLKALEKEKAELQEKFSAYEKENLVARDILTFMASDEELTSAFRSKWEKRGVSTEKETKKEKNMDNEEIKTIKEEVEDVKLSLKEKAIKEFEEKYGITRLPAEEQKKIRNDIRQAVEDMGGSFKTIPADKISRALEVGYKAIDPEGAKKAEMSGYVKGYTNGVASMPTMQDGGATFDEGGEKLSEAQRKWAQKLGVDPKKAEEVYKNRENEKVTDPSAK